MLFGRRSSGNRASGITVSPGTNSKDMVVVSISLGGTPRLGVSIDGGTAEVEDSHEVEGEDTGRSRSRAIIVGDAAISVNIVKYFLIVCIVFNCV